jgi:aldehyde dehydrogenase (NAD+)
VNDLAALSSNWEEQCHHHHAPCNLELALRAVVFGALGTAGQRCTTTRRLIIQHSVYDQFCQRLTHTYRQIEKRIGHALDPSVLVGPLIDTEAGMSSKLRSTVSGRKEGNSCWVVNNWMAQLLASGCYIKPALAEVPGNIPWLKKKLLDLFFI